MGYCNKRKRSKRRRTRVLNAMKCTYIVEGREWSSDASSLLDYSAQGSKYTTFCSTHSHASNKQGDLGTIPDSIYLDDGTTACNFINSNVTVNSNSQVDTSSMDQHSTVNTDNMDDLWHRSDFSVDVTSNQEGDDANLECTSCSSDTMDVNLYPQYQHHCFDQITTDETASYQIMSLLDNAGAPRICYDRLIALLKKLTKKQGFNVQRTLNRDTLMKRLARKYKAKPSIQSSLINKQEVFRFTFQEMLQDLIHSSSKYLHQILPAPDHQYTDQGRGAEHELWNTTWMSDTFSMEKYHDFDANSDIMLPIILYMDKTGTDVNQRYSLEPVLFSLAAIPRHHRESRHCWRHLGFIPPKGSSLEEESSSSLQTYHNCLSFLLEGLQQAQQNPPIVMVQAGNTNLGPRRALLPLMIVMGDQLSQDTLCGRLKSNAGGAGRVC